jgi:DNA modification methylase
MDKTTQKIEEVKGRPMLYWYGKKPLQSIEYFPAQEKEVYGDINSKEFNKLFWGDNLQVLSHLLKEYRGKVNLIYIDPPFDSKAEYVKRVKIRGEQFEGQQQGLLEEKQYTDIWENDEYLQFMYERLQIMHELLSDKGSIYLHCDWHKSGYLRLVMDEVFGENSFVNEIIWHYADNFQGNVRGFATNHNNIYWYAKNTAYTANKIMVDLAKATKRDKRVWSKDEQKLVSARDESGKIIYEEFTQKKADDVWEIGQSSTTKSASSEYIGYPTQKPESLLERILKVGSNEGDLVMDCFCGSGTTLAVAQKLGRRWIGCDINLGAIQTATKRLNQIIQDQQKITDFKGLKAFKVLNVNEYDLFKNELEARDIIMDMYGIEPVKRGYFVGTLDNKYVKIMPLNRVLNKLDVTEVIKNVEKILDSFTAKKTSRADEETYEEGVLIIGSGVEGDAFDFIKKENKTNVKIEVRDIQSDKKSLVFKKPTEAQIKVWVDSKVLKVSIEDFFSPLLMQKLQLDNEKRLKETSLVKVEDFKQILDSVAVDVDYNGKLFNAEIMDLPDKKSVVKANYEYTYSSGGKKTVAIKIVDVLGEEYFETFSVEAK